MLYGAEHIKRYEETDGAEGFDWGDHGAHILVLTTVGRKSGEERKNALIFREVDGGYAIVSSYGGAPKNPDWHFNLEADPNVKVQIKADKFAAKARIASAEERAAIWPKMAEVWPDYNEYTKKTDRIIPIVILERQ
ncbi:nitroreductase family deazaflavin-dependent oxidoreductase [Streptomyces sp. SID13031]|uniref:nitroreductase family deazaflavin-dependent oxidoreductase n=1 Tax=Streptomyces sp. SID13031 TaxID=2706046 RepID=UPI0013CA2651|nr:nitroreductase family deazaflavin-dependent oxidoreductase [Streptomyces sp. SID13031]NEA37530.1 nitroreductase family deazaflavin-dependent oxidoreductase [Streptomyces sp. SID13031]